LSKLAHFPAVPKLPRCSACATLGKNVMAVPRTIAQCSRSPVLPSFSLSMKVRRLVFTVKHANHDAKERRNVRHASVFSSEWFIGRCGLTLGITCEGHGSRCRRGPRQVYPLVRRRASARSLQKCDVRRLSSLLAHPDAPRDRPRFLIGHWAARHLEGQLHLTVMVTLVPEHVLEQEDRVVVV